MQHNKSDENLYMLTHKRIDEVEKRLDTHFVMIEGLETSIKENTSSLAKNTELTQDIANNTKELVDLFKGAKAFRKFIIWSAGIASAVASIVALAIIVWQWYWGK